METYYISSTKYSIKERMTSKRGRVYDVYFRIVTLQGVEKQKKLSGFSTKREANAAYTDFVTKHCELIKGQKKRQEYGHPSVADLHREYLASLENQVKESTIYDKIKHYRLFIEPTFGKSKINELTKTALLDWQEKLWRTKNPTTNKYYTHKYLSTARMHLSSFLTWVQEKHGYANELVKIKKPKKRTQPTAMQYWTREDFDIFLDAIDNPLYKTFFSILFFTGRRKGEVIALQNTDVSPTAITFSKTYSRKTIDGSPYTITTTKNEKADSTIICKPLQRILSTYEPQSPFFFGGAEPIHENTISHAFERYVKKAGLKKIRIHDLRHSFVSMCIHLGASVYVVADLIGDKPEQVLKTYGHLYQEDKERIINSIT